MACALFVCIFLSASFAQSSVPPQSIFAELPPDKEVVQILNVPFLDQDLPNEINLLVWNVYKGKKEGLYQDLKKLTPNYDFLLLQEAYLTKEFVRLYRSEASYTWIMATSFYDTSNVATGVVTASLQKPTEISFVRSSDHEPITNTPKVALAHYYPVPGRKTLLVLNIHGINFVSTDAYERQIKDVFRLIEKHKGPVIFGGDFNTWNSGRMQILKEYASRFGLQHVDLPKTGFFHLDHVFQRGFEVLEARVLENVTTSDHYPLSIKLRLGNSVE